MPDKKKVTVRPPLSREVDAKIDYIAKVNDMPKERAVAAFLRRGISLEEAGDAELKRIMREESAEYRIARSNGKKGVRIRNIKKKVATVVGG